ncbi:hypothetical protein FQN60_011327 [Etheostoma spectabile]|uniref:Uncharacterized protein n=1 Tax=Etheostoma spectabile TaxID=54343 RepID=A0A5J5DRR4_9PERO|nr:hypothetical protein FQN60_011327 [Etheostoma spectabile]
MTDSIFLQHQPLICCHRPFDEEQRCSEPCVFHSELDYIGTRPSKSIESLPVGPLTCGCILNHHTNR